MINCERSLVLITFNVYGKYLTMEALEELRVGGQLICTVKYVYDLVLLVREKVLHELHDRQTY
jgi:hypothetical protein